MNEINRVTGQYVENCMLTYIHTNVRTYIHTYIHTHTHTYIYIYIHIHTYIYTNIHAHIRTYIHTHTYIHTYIHTHTYIYTYMHIYTNKQTNKQTQCTLHIYADITNIATLTQPIKINKKLQKPSPLLPNLKMCKSDCYSMERRGDKRYKIFKK